MAYQALARKWRPRLFQQLVGQDHVVRALVHAVEQDRLHHAYLFTGTRGVGKTTLARILAKAINCEAGVGGEPCGRCSRCLAVDEGRYVDLIEVDAASRTRVEDTRDLLDNVLYAPTQGRCKVYLIDEVHMLSAHSFNALLKTLEEPPEHVKFLLATTDPQKIPVTILSRCLQFNLKRLSLEQIRGQLALVLEREGIPFEAHAVSLLARAADGSLRDGLSLLDQAISHGAGALVESQVADLLGTLPRAPVLDLLTALARFDAKALLAGVAVIDQWAPDYEELVATLLSLIHHAAVAQWAPEAIQGEDDAKALLHLAQTVSAEDLQLFYQMALKGQRDLRLSPDPRIGFEMLMLRMVGFRPLDLPNHDAASVAGSPPTAPRSDRPSQSSQPKAESHARASVLGSDRPAPASLPKAESIPPAPAPTPKGPSGSPQDPANWPRLLASLGLTAMAQELASHTVLMHLSENECCIGLDARHGHLKSPRAVKAIELALSTHLARSLRLRVELIQGSADTPDTPATLRQRSESQKQADAVRAIESDPVIQALRSGLEARILPGTIQVKDETPIDKEDPST